MAMDNIRCHSHDIKYTPVSLFYADLFYAAENRERKRNIGKLV